MIAPPMLVAHRAGNDLARLVRAERAGADLIELDVHLRRGRLEVRHLKALGPLPFLWDRWELRRRTAPLLLEDVLDVAERDSELLLDLKGFDPRMARAVSRVLAEPERERGRAIAVCGRDWRSIDELGARSGVRRIYSAGDRLQLARLLRRLKRRPPPDGVSIHQRLLDRALVAELREVLSMILTWPVPTVRDADRLAHLGVGGLICGSESLVTAIRQAAPRAATGAA